MSAARLQQAKVDAVPDCMRRVGDIDLGVELRLGLDYEAFARADVADVLLGLADAAV